MYLKWLFEQAIIKIADLLGGSLEIADNRALVATITFDNDRQCCKLELDEDGWLISTNSKTIFMGGYCSFEQIASGIRTMVKYEVGSKTEPIRAYKWATLYVHMGNQVKLKPLNTVYLMGIGWFNIGHLYSPHTLKSTCKVKTGQLTAGTTGRDNCINSPGDDCFCGWYGLKTENRCLWNLDSSIYSWLRNYGVLLDVEFYGKVIEHRFGYRAEYQRIMRINVPESMKGYAVIDTKPNKYYGSIEWFNRPMIDLVKNGFLANQLSTEVVLADSIRLKSQFCR